MSNFADNIIDQNGQQIYLEDKHLNDQTSQTTVATTDAVMLKDTNGEYHSIDKASFNEAVRASLGSILTNFDKGSSITRIPGIDSNNDLGSVTAANLASVLGGQLLTLTQPVDDVRTNTPGLYLYSTGAQNKPSNSDGLVLVFKRNADIYRLVSSTDGLYWSYGISGWQKISMT